MRWLKIDLWKLIISVTGLLLFLAFIVLVPATLVGAHGKTSGLAPTATVKASPTVDVTATMNALQEEKLSQDIAKDKSGIAKDQSDIDKNKSDIFWAWTGRTPLTGGRKS